MMIAENGAQRFNRTAVNADNASMPADLASILRIEIPVIVEIGSRQMSVKDVIRLAPGAIIELNKPVDEALGLLANNKRIGNGRAVKVGENFGIRVDCVGTASEMLAAMRERPASEPGDEQLDEAMEELEDGGDDVLLHEPPAQQTGDMAA